jgi:spore germination protein GerM
VNDQLPVCHPSRPAARAAVCLVCALVALLLAACGGDSASTATATTVSANASATVTPPSSATSGSGDNATATTVATATESATDAPTATSVAGAATASATPSGDALTLKVYFLRDGRIATVGRVVPHTLQVAAAAMDELLKGPTDQDDAGGFSTAIPAGTQYISTAIEGETATVNLSGAFATGGDSASQHARLAQVVYTLTQFPTIGAVQFALDGEIVDVFGDGGPALDHPQTRADYEDITPAILVETPTPGGRVEGATLRIAGTANTFEATFNATVKDANGQTLAEQVVTATSGSGTRGTFDATLDLAPTQASQGTLTVYEASAKDGSPQNVVEIPITFGS